MSSAATRDRVTAGAGHVAAGAGGAEDVGEANPAASRPEVRPLVPGSRICMVLLTGIGDVVHGLPVANALKAHDPTCHVTWIVEPTPSHVIRHHPAIDEVIVYEKWRGWRGVRDLWRQMQHRQFDVTLNFHIYFKSIWPTAFSRARRRIGFGRERSREGVWLTLNEPLPAGTRAHTQDMFLEFLDHLGVPHDRLEWQLTFTAAERDAQRDFFARFADRPVAVVVPASAMPPKDWTADGYAAVIDALSRDFGFRVLLVGGPSRREAGFARAISERCAQPPEQALGDDVRRLMWLVAGSDLVIAPDTGPAHIARAAGVPVIGLFGHTNPWRVGPYRAFEDLWVDAYTDHGQPPDPSCVVPKQGRMEQITAARVVERVRRAVDRYGVLQRSRSHDATKSNAVVGQRS
jgi:heptosyltransferase I